MVRFGVIALLFFGGCRACGQGSDEGVAPPALSIRAGRAFDLTVPGDASATPRTALVRRGTGVVCGWDLHPVRPWADYGPWVAKQLAGEYSSVESSTDRVVARQVEPGDVYEVQVERRVGDGGITIHVEFAARAD